jgi:hypothetical protein
MVKRGPRLPLTTRVQALVDTETAIRMEEALAGLKRQNIRASVSSFVEIALLELLSRRDLADVLRKRGATARRQSETDD